MSYRGEADGSCFPRPAPFQPWGDVQFHSLVQRIVTSCPFSIMFFRSAPSCCFPKPDSGLGSNYLTHTCTLLTSSFLSTTFPLNTFSPSVVRILFLKHHLHHTPPPAAPNCIKSKPQSSAPNLPPLVAEPLSPLQLDSAPAK